MIQVRVKEWTEWIPQEQHVEFPDEYQTSGITSLVAGPDEKLLEVTSQPLAIGAPPTHPFSVRTGRNGEGKIVQWQMWAFRAVFAQEVSNSDMQSNLRKQGKRPDFDKQERDKAKDLVLPPGV